MFRDCQVQVLSRDAMQTVAKVEYGPDLLPRTLEVLKHFGRRGYEGFGLWVGQIQGPRASITDLLVPPQRSLKGEDGVGYFLEAETLFDLNVYLSNKQLRLIAQVHSHPTEAYHSAADDRYAIATAVGSFSVVVPDFGFCEPALSSWAVYRLSKVGWGRLGDRQVLTTFIARKSDAH